jgi:hypothetical protein
MNDRPTTFFYAVKRTRQHSALWTWGWVLLLSSLWTGLQAQTQTQIQQELFNLVGEALF